jgi:hypothetical protein
MRRRAGKSTTSSTGPPRAGRQAFEQRAAQPTPLPVVGYGDRDLDDLRVHLRTDVARDPEGLAVGRIDGDDRLVFW